MSKSIKFTPVLPTVQTTINPTTLPPVSFKPVVPAKATGKNKTASIEYVFLAMPMMVAYNYINVSNHRNIINICRSVGHQRRVRFAINRIIDPIRDTMILSEDNHGTPNWVMIKVEVSNHTLMMKSTYRPKWSVKDTPIIRMDDPTNPNPENMALVQTSSMGHRNTCPIFVDMYEKDERLKAFCIMNTMLTLQLNKNEAGSSEDGCDLDISGSFDGEIDDEV